MRCQSPRRRARTCPDPVHNSHSSIRAIVAAALFVAATARMVRRKRTEHLRVQAGDIRDEAVEQSHEVA